MRENDKALTAMSEVARHKLKGVMIHGFISESFLLMNMRGFAKQHRKHQKCEYREFVKLTEYIIERHGYIPDTTGVRVDDEILATFSSKYNRTNLTPETKRKAVSYLLDYIVEWEEGTIDTLGEKYDELCACGCHADAIRISRMIEDTDSEVQKYIEEATMFEDINYDMVEIMDYQHTLKEELR